MFRIFCSIVILSLQLSVTTVRAECGYSACHKTDPNKLNVHLIAHSHDDVGWMHTTDVYYEVEVRRIITNVVASLRTHAHRKFIQVEMYFFNRWWREQNDTTHSIVRGLVKSGRLAFVNGGWTVNDEGAAHYNNIIDQMTLGLKFLNDTFGSCGQPKTSWQIDPFGHSREMASLFAQMGFDGHVINRGTTPKGEFVWKASPDLGTHIMTTTLHDHYIPPQEFEFEDGRHGITDYNAEQKANHFVEVVKKWNENYGNTSHVMFLMGNDFAYKNAENWFSNMDKLIHAVKVIHPGVDVFYSTPDCYIKDIHSLNRTFAERDVDYLTYWTGYYTNRPSLKYQDRKTNNLVQASKQLDVLARLDYNKTRYYVNEGRNQLAVLTHHDAITGTSPQHVVDDYNERLQSAYSSVKYVVRKALHYLKNREKSFPSEVFCELLNITECNLTESTDKIAVTLYNPIAKLVSQYIRVPVVFGKYEVFDANGLTVSQKALLAITDAVKSLHERRSNATHELYFKVQLPALGFTTYFIERTGNTTEKVDTILPIGMKGKTFTLQIDEKTGALNTITINGKTHKFHQSFKYYKSIGGKRGYEDSGSYHFCPDGTAESYVSPKLISRQISGGIQEVNQQFSDYVKQTVRTYEDEDYIEFDWTVGPIPIGDRIGKEVITRIETDLKTDHIFYTDANGRQTIKRRFEEKKRGCTDNNVTGNWYPIYSRIAIRDENEGLQVTVLTDRSQGGSSLKEGEIDLMVHRRLTFKGEGGDFIVDDPGENGKGLVVRGRHKVFFQPISRSSELAKSMAESLFMSPILLFDKYSTIKEYSSQRDITFSALSHSLPESVHLLTLENWRPNQVLIRLEHMYEKLDNSPLSKPVELNLENLFKNIKILDSVETTLTANQLLSELKRFNWKSNQNHSDEFSHHKVSNNTRIALIPQQIRTFILTVEDNTHREENCSFNWVVANQSTIPSDAYVGGYDIHNETLHVCRQTIGSSHHTGKANSLLGCVVPYDEKEYFFDGKQTFEVLVAKNVQWVPRHGTDPVPSSALVVGENHNNRVYVGRCLIPDSLVVGKIDNNFYYGFHKREWYNCINHEVLICS